MNKSSLEMRRDNLSDIYVGLNEILGELESSNHFSYIPKTKESGWEHYELRLQKIREEIGRRFLWDKETRDNLYVLVEEVECLIKSCSVPGVSERWLEINPCLKFYDAVYEVIGDYICAKCYGTSGVYEMPIMCSFYPTIEDCEAREEYFNERKRKNEEYNLQYSEERWLQDELQRTLQMLFEKEFA